MKCSFILSLILISCANGQHGVGEFSYFGSDANYPAVEAAARQWDKCGITIIVNKGGSDVPIIEVNNIDNSPNTIGRTYFGKPGDHLEWIKFVGTRSDHVQGIMEHEFGHAMGRKITHTTTGVMQPHWLVGEVELTDCWYVSNAL